MMVLKGALNKQMTKESQLRLYNITPKAVLTTAVRTGF